MTMTSCLSRRSCLSSSLWTNDAHPHLASTLLFGIGDHSQRRQRPSSKRHWPSPRRHWPLSHTRHSLSIVRTPCKSPGILKSIVPHPAFTLHCPTSGRSSAAFAADCCCPMIGSPYRQDIDGSPYRQVSIVRTPCKSPCKTCEISLRHRTTAMPCKLMSSSELLLSSSAFAAEGVHIGYPIGPYRIRRWKASPGERGIDCRS